MPAPLDGLTGSQHAAVVHAGGPLLVLGGAGSGKTHVLMRRFAWIAEHGTPAHRMLALTLGPAAASALRARIEELVTPPYEQLNVETFRSLCERVLREEALEAGLDPDFAPVTAPDRVALLLDRIDELQLRHHEIRGNPAPLLAGFVGQIDRLKEEMIGCEVLLSHAQRTLEGARAGDDAERARAARAHEFALLYAAHERLLEARGALDSGDLVLRAFRLLHERPHVRERVSGRFDHVLVDEYQDANPAQTMLLGLLCEGRHAVTVAGDDDQAIHRFRGAAQKNLRDFERAFGEATVVRLARSLRCGSRILAAAEAVVAPLEGRLGSGLEGSEGGTLRCWRATSERAQAQAVAREAERLLADGVEADRIAVIVRSTEREGPAVLAALEERAVASRLTGPQAYFQRAEVRDVLAWLRLLADPGDSGAAVRALSRPPIGLHSVDVARLTQLARRRKLDMPAAVAAALEGPQLTPEGRDRAQAFLHLYRGAASAYEHHRPDRFVLRLIERIGVRRLQVFATQADTVQRLRTIARLPELASAFVRRERGASARDFTRYLRAVADSGLREDEADEPFAAPAVRIVAFDAAKGLEVDHAFVLGLSADSFPGREPIAAADIPGELLRERVATRGDHAAWTRRLLHVAITRATTQVVLAWADHEGGAPARPSPFYEEARAAAGADEEAIEEELFGPAEGLHAAFAGMRDELLEVVQRAGGRLGEMRLDAGADVAHAVGHYLELIKVAALIERSSAGQPLGEAIAEVNALLAQGAGAEQRAALEASPLDDWLRDPARDPRGRPAPGEASTAEPSLDPFIPRRRGSPDGLMLSASDIETYRICPLKYKFARVFRIPQEATIHQRFGIALHQVLERFHQHTGGTREELMELFEGSWRRGGFGDSDDELQFRERALDALDRYWEQTLQSPADPVWFERSFSFTLGGHLVRGRVDRIDRHPDGGYELIDYKTGKARTERQLREDVQLSLYQMGARESWQIETSAQSYLYVMSGEKVPVAHTEDELERVRTTVAEIGAGIARHDFQPTPSEEICSFCDYRIICPAAER